ncbi:hypothetical protein ACFUCQ_37230 [Streptomyces sp. NPDC057197]|uniref:hypothetical protein n=1 Tax=Streptomyces sp. NPDC057197 TaxID=3346045 RepID=UPI00362E7774
MRHPARAAALEEVGAQVTTYGEGMAERVGALAAGPVDRALDTAPTGPVQQAARCRP